MPVCIRLIRMNDTIFVYLSTSQKPLAYLCAVCKLESSGCACPHGKWINIYLCWNCVCCVCCFSSSIYSSSPMHLSSFVRMKKNPKEYCDRNMLFSSHFLGRDSDNMQNQEEKPIIWYSFDSESSKNKLNFGFVSMKLSVWCTP